VAGTLFIVRPVLADNTPAHCSVKLAVFKCHQRVLAALPPVFNLFLIRLQRVDRTRYFHLWLRRITPDTHHGCHRFPLKGIVCAPRYPTTGVPPNAGMHASGLSVVMLVVATNTLQDQFVYAFDIRKILFDFGVEFDMVRMEPAVDQIGHGRVFDVLA